MKSNDSRISATCLTLHLSCLLLLLLISVKESLSSDPLAHDADERSRNTTNATALEKGSIHASSKLMTWILGFVFVTVISLSSMLGLLLIPDSRNKNRVTTAVVKSPSSASSSHGQRSEMNHAGECTCHPSLLTADKRLDIHSGSACSFVALGSEGSHEEIMEQTAVTASSASSPRGTDGEPKEDRGSEGGSLVNFSVSYMHNGLEGLALGSLLASSIFHLIPHAFDLVGQDQEHNYLFTSLLIFTGIYCFYWSEKILILISDYRKIRNRKKNSSSVNNNSSNKGSSSVTSHVNKISDIRSNHEDGQADSLPGSPFHPPPHSPPPDLDAAGQARVIDAGSIASCYSCHPADRKTCGHVGLSVMTHDCQEEKKIRSQDQVTSLSSSSSSPGSQADADQERKDHLAWMVIIGDGIHNLIDGLSLGAALSDSHLTGFSIAIAILFEEIPHELGDYAILVSSGMTPRRAALCNLMSASTCYIGMVIGIICSDLSTSSSNSFIFAIAGGMFLYISIFNIMTDLNENFNTCRRISICTAMEMLFWQNLGILIGVYILYSLAQFDEKLLLQSLRIEL